MPSSSPGRDACGDRQRRRDAALPRHGHRHGEAQRRGTPRGPAPPARRARRDRDEASVAAYQGDARADVERITDSGSVALLVGGSGLYGRRCSSTSRSRARTPNCAHGSSVSTPNSDPASSSSGSGRSTPPPRAAVDQRNPRRLIRALEIASRSEVVTPSLPSAPRAWRPARILHLHRERTGLVASLHERAARMFDRGSSTRSRGSATRGWSRGRPPAPRSGTRRRSTCCARAGDSGRRRRGDRGGDPQVRPAAGLVVQAVRATPRCST